jgi:hypothetical protein
MNLAVSYEGEKGWICSRFSIWAQEEKKTLFLILLIALTQV